MRPNPDYALDEIDAIRALVRENPWATIVSHVPGRGLVASHYPMLLDEDADGLVLLSHVGRPDEQLHQLGSHELLVIVSGPHGYVSPGWYDVPTGVPTWDFAVAHLPDPFLMNRTLENADYAARIVHGAVGFRMRVERIEAKDKMSQDKPAEVVARIIDALRRPGPYQNPRLADRIASENGQEAVA